MPAVLRLLVPLALFGLVAACGDDGAAGFAEVRSDLARVSDPAVPSADAEDLEAGNLQFAFDLYARVSGEPGNVFFSPHSISVALAMAYAGMRTETEAQTARVLHFTLPQDRLHAAFNALDLELAQRSKVELPSDTAGNPPELHIANATWGDREYQFLDEYLDVLALNYGAGLRLLDFRRDSEGSLEIINSWVEEQTSDRIKDLIPEGAIDALTRLVLTNAIYFKGSWKEPFAEDRTGPGPFHLLDGNEVEAEMMHLSARQARYARVGSIQAVELGYVGDQISMLLLLPDEGGFAGVEARLDGAMLAEVLGGLGSAEVTLSMPKFEFEWELSLSDTLQDMGMVSAFGADADLSGMDGTRNLAITDVLHKAFVSVDELGTEAAAATAVIIGETSAGEMVEVNVDRPFIFLVRDNPTGAILFLGRVVDPGE
jgi:serpin B